MDRRLKTTRPYTDAEHSRYTGREAFELSQVHYVMRRDPGTSSVRE